MRLRPEQLAGQLAKQPISVCLIHGDEPLLIQEATDAVRAAARRDGYQDRETLTVETGFDWNRWYQASRSLSLFGGQRLLELHFNGKPDQAGATALTDYANTPATDTRLLITCGKLPTATTNSRWFRALDKVGVTVAVWPVTGQQLPAWIERRMRSRQLHPSADVVALLVERVEGNLLAAAQEVDKLALLLGSGPVSAEQLLASVSDSARFSIYDLVDSALAGQPDRVMRIISGLRGEGTEPVLALWALHREIRLLIQLRFAADRSQGLDAALTRHNVWEKRKPLIRRALQRLTDRELNRLLRGCSYLDRIIKGVTPGDPWQNLLALTLRLAGKPVPAEWDLTVSTGWT